MTAKRFAWFKFYPADWRTDPELGLCSLAARGLLAEILCVAHAAEPRGHLLVNGQPPSEAALARLARTSIEDARQALAELVAAGVVSVVDGVVISRRMVRDTADQAERSDRGLSGGNPTLTGKPKVNRADKQPDKPAGKRWQFSSLYVSPKMHAHISATVGKAAAAIDWDTVYNLAACDYAEQGQPANKLDDLQARARKAAGQLRSDAAAAEVQARTRAKLEERPELSPEEHAAMVARLKASRPFAVRPR